MKLRSENNRPASDAGFTLIELLVVILIIGLFTGIAVMNFAWSRPQADVFKSEIVPPLETTARLAVLEQRTLAVQIEEERIVIGDMSSGVWEEVEFIPVPDDIDVSLVVDGKTLSLEERKTRYLIFEPTGQSTPFELVLREGSDRVSLNNYGDGRIVEAE